MNEVNKNMFYDKIGGLNVRLTVKTNKKPYDVEFKIIPQKALSNLFYDVWYHSWGHKDNLPIENSLHQ